MANIELYKELAERNGWDLSMIDNRPYFMKNGTYVIPDEKTSEEDKELLANIISEGSIEMANLIINCWNNNISISGPCSGIREFHDKQPFALHFSFIAPAELINPLYESLKTIYPNFDHLIRDNNGMKRYDINYFLDDKELTADEADQIFATINQQLNIVLEKQKEIKNTK